MCSVLLKRQLLSRTENEKSVYLIELSIPDTNCKFEPGDIAFIYPQNNALFIEDILSRMSLSGNECVLDANVPLRTALRSHLELLIRPNILSTLPEELDFWQALELLHARYQSTFSAQMLCDWLKPMRPRAYSIASAQIKNPHVMELIVGLVTFKDLKGGINEGLSSGFLCKRLQINECVRTYVKTSHFKLPKDNNAPVIMVGPGTGIAPFKAFLEARKAMHATGLNWLFFGGRYRNQDFILQDLLEGYQQEGFLTHLDLAFSRDQDHKVYVQHKMLENAQALWNWLQKGAYFYICGDAKSMAKDVESSLCHIISSQGNLSEDQAMDYLKTLKAEGRYQKDVY